MAGIRVIIWMEDPSERDLYLRRGRALVPFPWKDRVEHNNRKVSLVKKKHADELRRRPEEYIPPDYAESVLLCRAMTHLPLIFPMRSLEPSFEHRH